MDHTIATKTLVWAAGIRAVSFLDTLGFEQDRLGRIKVNEYLQVPLHPEIFVIGDAAYLEDENGAALPMVAPVALQQADYVFRIIRNVEPIGNIQKPFVYHSPGLLATIGQ